MEKYFLFIITISLISCKSNYLQDKVVITSEQDKKVIREFIDSFCFNEVYDYDNATQYLNLYVKTPEEIENNKGLLKFIHEGMRELVKHHKYSKEYKIFNYSEAKDNSIISRNSNFTKLSYKEKENVYYVVFSKELNEVGFFILNDDKINSFFGNYTIIGTDSIYPYMLNKKPTLLMK